MGQQPDAAPPLQVLAGA